jgi:hypothetical protein
MKKHLTNERGMALAVVLALLLMMGLIGIASIKTSVLDMDMSRAMTDKVKSFYIADGGLELTYTRMQKYADVMKMDSLLKIVNTGTKLGIGYFNVQFTNTYPTLTVISEGHDQEGASAVAVNVFHRRNPFNPWNNAIFAGVGKSGKGIAGNVDIRGSVHILGEGEPFTDQNGDGVWNDADTYVDLNGNGTWQPGEPLSVDSDGDGAWDPAEPFVDENGSGAYDQTLTATDLSFEASGTAAIGNNYSGMNATLAARVPALPKSKFNGEDVETLKSELRVKHGLVNLSGTAHIGSADVSGGSPKVKETMDGVFVNDGFGGTSGTNNVYSDNGTKEQYDLGDGIADFPSLNDTSNGYADHRAYLGSNALVISGDLTLTPGVAYTSPYSPYGSLSIDAAGNMRISGVVLVKGNVYIEAGSGKTFQDPIVYDGRGTLAAGGNMIINTSVISKDEFTTDDVMGFIAYQDMIIGGGSGAPELSLMGAFYAQNEIEVHKPNAVAGALVSNYFDISEVPTIYQVPTLAENIPPGMPGATRWTAFYWKKLKWTWHELS